MSESTPPPSGDDQTPVTARCRPRRPRHRGNPHRPHPGTAAPAGAHPPTPAVPYGGTPYGTVPAMMINNQKALWAMVLGILGIVCCPLIAGIPAIVLGKQAQREIDASGVVQSGRGMATAGFVLGIISCVFAVLSLVLLLTGAFTLNTSP